MTYRPLRCACRKRVWESVIRVLKRQAPVLLVVVAAAFVAAGTATGDPASARSGPGAAGHRPDPAARLEPAARSERATSRRPSKLHAIEHSLKINKIGLRAARANLARSQIALSQRLVAIYTTRDDQSTLAVHARRAEHRRSRQPHRDGAVGLAQDAAVMNQVIGFRHAGDVHRRALVARASQPEAARRAARCGEGEHRLATHRQQQLLASIKGEIAHSIAWRRPGSSRSAAGGARAVRRRRSSSRSSRCSDTVGRRVGLDAGRLGRAAVAVHRRRRGRDALPRRAVRLGRLQPERLRLLRPRCLRLRARWASRSRTTPARSGTSASPVSRSDLQPGDLVFFDGLGHVGIYIGGGQFIHAPHTGDVVKIARSPAGTPTRTSAPAASPAASALARARRAAARARAARRRRPASPTRRRRRAVDEERRRADRERRRRRR